MYKVAIDQNYTIEKVVKTNLRFCFETVRSN